MGLNRAKVVDALQKVKPQLFPDTQEAVEQAVIIFKKICDDHDLFTKIEQLPSERNLPYCIEPLKTAHSIQPYAHSYSVTAIDGSQIYPDKHEGISCYVINVGMCTLHYKSTQSEALFDTVPSIFVPAEMVTPEMVNNHRLELELQTGLTCFSDNHTQNEEPKVLFFDGSLIFWHLLSAGYIKNDLFDRCIALLDHYYQKKIIIASYVSLPKNRELMEFVRRAAMLLNLFPDSFFETIDDATVLSHVLKPLERSAIFKSNAACTVWYPPAVQPHFVYVHGSQEVFRLEFPAWIAQNEDYVNLVTAIALDQQEKGYGYPVCLAEAHEQAVVKAADRDFFYYALRHMSISQNAFLTRSQKLKKKQSIGV